MKNSRGVCTKFSLAEEQRPLDFAPGPLAQGQRAQDRLLRRAWDASPLFSPDVLSAIGSGRGGGRRALLCPEPTEGAFACAEATVGYNWDGPSFPYKQIGGQTSIYSIVSPPLSGEGDGI